MPDIQPENQPDSQPEPQPEPAAPHDPVRIGLVSVSDRASAGV
jgi:hypothetical protein